MLDPDLLEYNATWDDIDNMLNKATSPEFRNETVDSNGNGWVYNWFCADFVDYEINPRRRAMGYHAIFDHYQKHLQENDTIQFHYHPHPFKNHAHLCATNWLYTNKLEKTLSRRIIDRNWFPAVNRPGFQVTRPDSNWFLEQYIPFDYASMAIKPTNEDKKQFDFSGGRSGDWRWAPRTWHPYHPSHDDYQTPGNCRRWITRCLNIGTRSYLLTEDGVRQAFKESSEKPQILSFTNHDFRDITKDITAIRQMIETVRQEYPDVEYEFTDAVTAMRKALNLKKQPRCEFKLKLEGDNKFATLIVKASEPTFGPQPYLALKTVTDQYLHDNFDFQKPFLEWTYVFDNETLKLNAIEKIGVAANNAYGKTTVSVIDVETRKITNTYLNEEKKNAKIIKPNTHNRLLQKWH